MKTFYDYLLTAHETGYEDDLPTFLDGFFAAVDAFGISCPFGTDDPIARQNWVLALIAESDRKRTLNQRAAANMILQQYTAFLDKEAYRGMIFDRIGVNSGGKDVDYGGDPIDEIRHCENVTYQSKRTGKFLHPRDYDTLIEEKKKEYTQVRYYEIPGTNGFAIYSSDTAMMTELIHHDILLGDAGVNQRYYDESRHPNSDLYPYRQVIEDAIMELESLTDFIGYDDIDGNDESAFDEDGECEDE